VGGQNSKSGRRWKAARPAAPYIRSGIGDRRGLS